MKQVAFLSDRIRSNECRPQIYGTVLDWNERGELSCELEDPQKIDKLREGVGLPPFEKTVQEQQQEVEKEGGRPREDIIAWKQEDWAKRVRWR